MLPGVSLLHSLLFVLVLLAGGQGRAVAPERFEYTEIHMAMPVRIVMYAPDSARARAAAKSAYQRIATLEATMSDYRAQSELRRLQARPGRPVPVSADLFDVLQDAVNMAALTDGAFDPTAGAFVALWRDARRSRTLPTSTALDAARAHTGWTRIAFDHTANTIRLNGPVQLDLGAIAKGYILGEASAELRRFHITRMMIEAGGDIVVGEAPPDLQGWRIEVPGASASFARHAASLTNAALATSGPDRQHVEINGVRYSHVIDPRTGMALTRSTTAWVIARDAATADALATALTVMHQQERDQMRVRFPDVHIEVRE